LIAGVASLANLLLRVESCEVTPNGLVLKPLVPMRDLVAGPQFRGLKEGTAVELRRPDGTRREARLAALTTPGADDDSEITLYEQGGPGGSEWDVAFTLAGSLAPADIPPGSELWSVD
jgi:hypothetical protein